MKKFISSILFSILCIANAQNNLLPAKYYTYQYAINPVAELDTFTDVLHKVNFINDSVSTIVKEKITHKKLKCFLDILSQCNNVKIYYNNPAIVNYKLDFLNKVNDLKKLAPLKMLDSVWYEYFRDTLNKVAIVNQYSGYKLCMKSGNIIVKERIYIPITNTGQFYGNHYAYEYEDYLVKSLNQFLSVVKSAYRLGAYANPLFFHPVTDAMQDADGVAFIFLNESQVEFYQSNDYWNKYYRFHLFYTHFDNYNANGKKEEDIKDISGSNMMWYYDEITKRNIVRIMSETYFKDFSHMMGEAHVNNSFVMQRWGVYPGVYTNFITELVEHTKNRIQAKVIYDGYPVCKKDSFIFKVEMNKKIYSGKYHFSTELDFRFLTILYNLVKDAIPERVMYVASTNGIDLFYVLVNESEKEYILSHKMFNLYDITQFK